MPNTAAASSGIEVAVVGAGVGGMAAAIRLAEAGRRVAVFDPSLQAGGLAGGFEVGGGSVERYYHHVFRSDTAAARWINELGLGARLEFLPADMGFFSGGRLHRFGTPLSLLRFSRLPFLDRVRLGLRIRSIASMTDPAPFENITAVDWLEQRASRAEMEVFWTPLLTAKFGDERDLVSMAWLWARFRARVGGSIGRAERLGYLRGGFQQLGDAMSRRAEELGVEVHLGRRVTAVSVEAGRVTGISTDEGAVHAAAVLWTPSLNAMARAVPSLPAAYRAICEGVRYHTAVVMVVELAASALPFYWVTVGDRDLPFTVAVEHTRLVGTTDYGGRTIVYLGRYAAPETEIAKATDAEVAASFLEAATQAFGPAFRTPLAAHVFRAPGAQPIVPPGWDTGRPSLTTGIGGLVAANMAQIYPWDRGINYSVELGERAASAVLDELTGTPTALPSPAPTGQGPDMQ
jgi:protoporphyrinogen oxidase